LFLPLLVPLPLFAQDVRLDRHGDPLPTGATMRLGSARFRTLSHWPFVAQSRDGRTLVTAEQGRVCFWDMATGRERYCVKVDYPGPLDHCVLSPDGRRFAAVFGDRYRHNNDDPLIVAEVDSGKILHRSSKGNTSLICQEFNHDGSRLIFTRCSHEDPQFKWMWFELNLATEGTRRLPGDGYTLSPDGRRLLEWREGEIRVRESETGRVLSVLDTPKGDLGDLTFIPDGRTLIGHYLVWTKDSLKLENPCLCFWDIATGKLIGRIEESVLPCASSPDGKMMAGEVHAELVVVDLGARRVIFRVNITEGQNSLHKRLHCCFSPDGKTLYWADDDNRISRWDAPTGKVAQWRVPVRAVRLLAATPDGSGLIVAGDGLRPSIVVACDAATGRLLPWSESHLAGITEIVFAPDGKTLATRDGDGMLRLWNVASSAPFVQGPSTFTERCESFGFTPDGRTIITDSYVPLRLFGFHVPRRTVGGWRLGDGPGLKLGWSRTFMDAGTLLAPDGRSFASVNDPQPGTVRLWDTETGKVLHEIKAHPTEIWQKGYQATGRLLVTRDDDSVRVWDVKTGGMRKAIPWTKTENGALTISPDSQVFAWVRDSSLAVWSLRDDRLLWRQPLPKGDAIFEFFELEFSLDGRTLVTQKSSYGKVDVWETDTGKLIRTVHGPRKNGSLFLTRDGRDLVAASVLDDYSTFHLSNTSTGGRMALPGILEPLCSTFLGRTNDDPARACLDLIARDQQRLYRRLKVPVRRFPDGRALAVCGESVRCYDATSGRPLGYLPPGHKGRITALAFSPDGNTLATGGEDGTVLLWDVRSLSGNWPPQLVTYPQKELTRLWDDLAREESHEQAVYQLLGTPKQAVDLLARRLQPLLQADPARIARLVADLDSEVFEKREAASAELAKIGKYAERELNRALAKKPSAELRRCAAELYEQHRLGDLTPEMRRAAGAIRVLELLGTDAARKILEDVSHGPNGAWLTEESNAALRRWR
jgi:WD40 repeat protein